MLNPEPWTELRAGAVTAAVDGLQTPQKGGNSCSFSTTTRLTNIRGEQVRTLQQSVETLQTSSDAASREGEKTAAALAVAKAELTENHEKVLYLSFSISLSLSLVCY